MFESLPTLADVEASRRGKSFPKGASRLELKVEAKVDEKKAEARWKKEVWRRDGGRCRCCRRRVEKRPDLVPSRGECHHISGRAVRAVRWDVRNGLLVCKQCHDEITGAVGTKLVIESKHTFTVENASYLNADKKVRFVKVTA